jgi:hypothetical protein
MSNSSVPGRECRRTLMHTSSTSSAIVVRPGLLRPARLPLRTRRHSANSSLLRPIIGRRPTTPLTPAGHLCAARSLIPPPACRTPVVRPMQDPDRLRSNKCNEGAPGASRDTTTSSLRRRRVVAPRRRWCPSRRARLLRRSVTPLPEHTNRSWPSAPPRNRFWRGRTRNPG